MTVRWIVVAYLCCSTTIAGQSPLGLCVEWGEAREVGQLDPGLIAEASGVAASYQFPNRLYHVEDSSTTLFVIDPAGQLIQSPSIEGMRGTDVEDLALGPCGSRECLFVADIGDNVRRRDSIEVIVVEEVEDFPEQVTPRQRIRLRYPNGPQDAEALGVSSRGDIYVISRTLFPLDSQSHAELFMLSAERWSDSGAEGIHTLERLRSIEMRRLSASLPGQLVTGVDISRDNRRVLLSTYVDAFEFQVDSDPRGMLRAPLVEGPNVEGQNYVRVPLVPLRQQEGVAYLPEGDALIYTTEAGDGAPLFGPSASPRSPIMRIDCIRRD